MTGLVQLEHAGERRWAIRLDDGGLVDFDLSLAELLAMPLAQARAACDVALARHASLTRPEESDDPPWSLVAPVDTQEVWAAGVTYQRSREGRREESGHGRLYDLVYDDERPELFFKATAARVVGPDAPVGIRADSDWNVPEPEVGLVVNSGGELFGYTVGNDMSSRSIEGANPLYLPQAKSYDRSCALGPEIVPTWRAGAGPFGVSMWVRRAGREVYSASISTAAMARRFDELIDWSFRALAFPTGLVLLTGTGIVPDRGFTLHPGDVVDIVVERIGRLVNPVAVVGGAGALPRR